MWNRFSSAGRSRAARPGRLALEALELRCVLSAIVCHDDHDDHGIDANGFAYDALPLPDFALAPAGDYQAGDGAAGGSPSGSGNPLDLSQTFALHSLAGADHVIYLDFTGGVTSGTAWNSGFTGGADIVTPAYDTDGNAGSFSNAELAQIQYIWQRVAEDFAPFHVNVTTQDPGSEALRKSGTGDAQWGIRVVIGGNGSWYGSAGGVAYLGSFNWNTDTPTFVFSGMLGNGNEKYTAEAISHEVGHTLGLSHDGTSGSAYYQGSGSGATGWAPIMGSGYYQNLTQFSSGQYSGANNKQDDLTIITTQNGFGYRADDYGNTTGTAHALTPSGTTIAATGIIERTGDADVFGFYTGAGKINLSVVPADRGPNLDIKASLYNAAGTLIASNNPTGSLSAAISATVAQGQYFLKVEGVGQGSPLTGYSNYASLGQYWFTGTIVNPGSVPVLSVSDGTADESAGTMTFRLSLAAPATGPLTVAYTTANGTALAGRDYVAAKGTVTFAAGESEKVVTVSLLNDAIAEVTESFKFNVSASGGQALIVARQGVGTIADDDVVPITVSVSDVTANEGNPNTRGTPGSTTFTFTITLSQASTTAVTVSYTTADGTAIAGKDYRAKKGTVRFAAGQTSKTVTVTVIGDGTAEANETFVLRLTGVTGAVGVTLGKAEGIGTIVNDDSSGAAGQGNLPGEAALAALFGQSGGGANAASPAFLLLAPAGGEQAIVVSTPEAATPIAPSSNRFDPAVSVLSPAAVGEAPEAKSEPAAPATAAGTADDWDFLFTVRL